MKFSATLGLIAATQAVSLQYVDDIDVNMYTDYFHWTTIDAAEEEFMSNFNAMKAEAEGDFGNLMEMFYSTWDDIKDSEAERDGAYGANAEAYEVAFNEMD